jgi:2-keto-4-pentenoate hydratase/2-oxohepta-3-ene-1,7-dioic acid hydratase in catechol pathway
LAFGRCNFDRYTRRGHSWYEGKKWLKPGDEVTVSIEKIGQTTNVMV